MGAFGNILGYIRGLKNKMFDNAGKNFNTDIAMSNSMITAIKRWTLIYENEAEWLNEDVVSLELGSTIAREFATLVTLEFETEITGSPRADFLNECYKKSVKKNLRTNVEYACAKGGMVIKPFVAGKKIEIEFIQADKFIPTEFNSAGEVCAGVFVSQKQEGRFYITRLEYHKILDNKKYLIQNKAFKSYDSDVLGQEIDLKSVPEWAEINEEVIIENIEKPLFSYFKMPFANTIDSESKIGVSVYSRSEKLIREADKQFSRILWEYEGSELAIDADITTLQAAKGMEEKMQLPHLKDRLFRGTAMSKDGDFYKVFSPAIRDSSLFNGLNNILKRIEFNVGLAYGTLSDPQAVEKTATEIESAKQRSYATVKDIQKALEGALENLTYAMDVMCTLYKLAPSGKYEQSFDWDDSMVVDAQAEQATIMQEVSLGLIKKEIYLQKRYGVTEEQAKKMLPESEEEFETKNNIEKDEE